MTRKPVIEVRRSKRRRRTVSAYRDGERVVVLIPAQFSRAGHLPNCGMILVSAQSSPRTVWQCLLPLPMLLGFQR